MTLCFCQGKFVKAIAVFLVADNSSQLSAELLVFRFATNLSALLAQYVSITSTAVNQSLCLFKDTTEHSPCGRLTQNQWHHEEGAGSRFRPIWLTSKKVVFYWWWMSVVTTFESARGITWPSDVTFHHPSFMFLFAPANFHPNDQRNNFFRFLRRGNLLLAKIPMIWKHKEDSENIIMNDKRS